MMKGSAFALPVNKGTDKEKKSSWRPAGQNHQQGRGHTSCGGCSACNKITSSPTPKGGGMLKSLSPQKKVCATRFLQMKYSTT